MVNYYLEESIMLYPARVKVGHGSYDYAMLSLEQANQKFVVIDGCLVEQDVVPMSADYVEERLKYETEALSDAQEHFEVCTTNYKEVLKTEIEKLKKDIVILTLAKQHYIDIEAAKALHN